MKCSVCNSKNVLKYGDICKSCLKHHTKDIKFKLKPKGKFDMRAVAGNVIRKR